MSTIRINGAQIGSALQEILMADDIQPGSDVSYQMCKTIFLAHPLGAKMVEQPIKIAQSQRREITITDGPQEKLLTAFNREWDRLGADRHIFNLSRTSRIYGIASVIYGSPNTPTDKPINPFSLSKEPLYFNVLDPLNTAGSLVLNQDPNAPDFQKVMSLSVQGSHYHRSRVCVLLNEAPIYIAYSQSAFGYVGRSVYQRALYPLKSFINSMITDDMVTRKAGVLIAKMKPAGSIVDRLMQGLYAAKRQLLVEAKTDNVLGISIDEEITSLNLENVDGANTAARKNILENIATATPMPAKLLLQETFAEGFGEGTEDAKHIAQYIDGVRIELTPVYAWFDRIVQHRAWNEEFYATIQKEMPAYKRTGYQEAFYRWQNSFEATWPSLIVEPDSEKMKVDQTKMESVVSLMEVLKPGLDPENAIELIRWAVDNINETKMLFATPLIIDFDALAAYEPPQPPGMEGGEPEEDSDQQVAEPKPPAPKKLKKAA